MQENFIQTIRHFWRKKKTLNNSARTPLIIKLIHHENSRQKLSEMEKNKEEWYVCFNGSKQ